MRDIEFYVRDVILTRAGEVLVVGVPNNRMVLSLGDRFEAVYELDMMMS